MRGHRAKGQRRAVFQLKAEIIPPRDQAEQQKRRSGGEGARSAGTHDRYCEGFRMPAADERCRMHRRPASESLQGRKPRWGNVGGAAC